MEYTGKIIKIYGVKEYAGYRFNAPPTYKRFMQLADEQGIPLKDENNRGLIKFMVQVLEKDGLGDRYFAQVGDVVRVTCLMNTKKEWRSVTLKREFEIVEKAEYPAFQGKIETANRVREMEVGGGKQFFQVGEDNATPIKVLCFGRNFDGFSAGQQVRIINAHVSGGWCRVLADQVEVL